MGFPLDLVQVALQQATTVEAAAALILSWLSSDSGAPSMSLYSQQLSGSVNGDRAVAGRPNAAGVVTGGMLCGVVADQDEVSMISWNSGVMRHLAPQPGQNAIVQPMMVHMNRHGRFHSFSHSLISLTAHFVIRQGCESSFRFIHCARVVGYEKRSVLQIRFAPFLS
jgi:hypothetical protein